MSATVLVTALQGRGLIEASAGTGKTYALAGLFARAVIVERLRVPQILAVTYTVAATQELHERVRLRLRAAADLAARWEDGDPAECASDDAETALLRRLLHAALHRDPPESLPALRLRLARAAREMDLAAITTIHGFCQRLLAEHALEARQPLVAPELVPANAAQRSALATALWREVARDAAGAEFLLRWFGDVDGLARKLPVLLAPEPLLPQPPDDACPRRDRAWAALRGRFAEEGAQVRATLERAERDKWISSAQKQRIPFDVLWGWLAMQGDTPPLRAPAVLERAGLRWLRGICLKKGEGRLPEPALCAAVDAYLDAQEACDLQRLHTLRALAREQDAATKRASHACDYDHLIAAVFAAVHDTDGPRLAGALRAQFPLVLVDEFQDTDARQWAIFDRLFGAGEGGLLLVGDPKQAIYRFRGGDVETYLLARKGADIAEPLRQNFRARPCVLGVVNALFSQPGAVGLLGDGIAFDPSVAGRAAECDAHLLRDGRAAPALTFHAVPPPESGTPGKRGGEWNKDDSTRKAARLCAIAIAELLTAARAGHALRSDAGRMRPLEARDCAVLVREHREAAAVRRALAELGVPAVSAGRQSLFATEHAQTLLALLLALAAPGDARRLRALLATPLFGYDAGRLQALDDDGAALREWQHDVMQWRLRWEQHGPQPMLADVLARQAPSLLQQVDGERALTCLLQLGELLQEARMRTLGPQGQVDWLRAAIAHADKDDETQWPRLESDAGRVQILTLHASKGLEFPLVFLPFVGIGRTGGNRDVVVTYHDDARQRVLQWKTDWIGDVTWDAARARAQAEERAEDMRLLYVGLTRAREALWLCGGALASSANSGLHRLLGGNAPSVELQVALDGQLVLLQDMPPDDVARLPASAPPIVPAARVPQRVLRRDWWMHSFSQLHRQRPHGALLVDEAPADDERPLAALDVAAQRFGGARFGNALHQALEHCDFARWREYDGSAIPDGEAPVLVQALRDQDYPEDSVADGLRELVPLVARTLNAPLPCDASSPRLCDVPEDARVAELEFHFTLADTDTRGLLALLHAHGIARERPDFGAWPRLSGLMTGKIDLTCRLDGRLWVLDYKSNRLPDYLPETLDRAMAVSEYDLQALLYVVALHRWLRLRRGAAYDYARDVGGAHYLFCRGIDPAQPGHAVATRRFDGALVTSVDALFGEAGAAS